MSSFPKSLPLSDVQLAMIFSAATPLPRADIDGYLELVAEQLRARSIIGDGDVHRAVVIAQKAFFVPPLSDERHGNSKYNRRSW
jgi:hypothetical protein